MSSEPTIPAGAGEDAAGPAADPTAPPPDFVVITGISGAGRSTVADALEDFGYFVIDNLPPALIGKMAELATTRTGEMQHIALVVDVRGGDFFSELEAALDDLARRGLDYRILFLTAADEVLITRYELTRRRHPLADRVVEGIAKERELLESLRGQADLVIDTTDLSPHELRERVRAAFSHGAREAWMKVTVTSFGFKYGIPLDADLVMDVRFLPNPHWVEELRPLTGMDERIRDFVLSRQATSEFLERFEDLLEILVPGYLNEGKRYLTIAIGCSGGRHRSVVVGEHIAARLREEGLSVAVEHRDVKRGSTG